MPDPHFVSATEQGLVRIFTTELEPEGDAAVTPSNVHKILGKDLVLDAAKVAVFPSKALAGLGLAAYLRDGYGIPEVDLAGKAAALDALVGLIILVPSTAFGGAKQVLDPNPAVRFIGTFHESSAASPVKMAPANATEVALTPDRDQMPNAGLERRNSSWIVALGALIVAATLVLFAVF